ncbi:Canalicular multispecific organic anion transporter 1-like protein 2 [Colletotrichum chlorophyti]|uniref:Canalicular multispecific organic anion transporter 1-like protein 2 n=1 Tax=Colletotrichum chlorophyti TaxID=708187 RepID=A0A1Q8RDC2_9PEZI|nr:Canalicular multispecific organic anion transporter 1-like protein 2 [Colletotrichum chlorophyti]
MSSRCLNDDSLGPGVRGCRGDFDFTLRFERIFLAILPAAVFAALSLPRIAYLARKPRIVDAKTVQTIKLAIITVFATLQFALLILQTTSSGSRIDGFAVTASSLSFLAALFMIGLSYAEHSRAPRPSILLTGYIFFQVLFDIAQTRTSWLMARSFPTQLFAKLFTASLVVKVVIFLVEAQKKTRWIRWTADEHSPEETSGLFSLGVYFWLNRLFLHGYRNVLTIGDLYALDQGMIAETMQITLDQELAKGTYRGKKHGLARTLAKALAVPLLLPVAPRIALIGFNFSQPFFIQSVLVYLQDTNAPKNVGYGLIGAAAMIYTGIAVANALYYYFQQRALYMSRGCLSAVIYKKTTEAALAEVGDAAAVTLMSTDTERIIRGFYSLHEFWANLIEIALGCWLLENQLGPSFIAPIIVIVVCTGVTAVAARYSGKRQSRWMSQIQKRVGLTANVISNMKYLRISGITAPVSEFVQQMRVDEMHIGNQFRWILIVTALAALAPTMISPAITFAFASSRLDTTTIFTAFSFLVLLNNPLVMLFQSVPTIIAGFTCLNRIQKFLEADSRLDFRQSTHNTALNGNASEDSSFRDSLEGIPLGQLNKSVRESYESGSSSPAITIADGSFGWTSEKMVLRNLTATVPASQLTLVVGPVASGKSTLCKVLLGEVPFSSGLVLMPSRSAAIGYCEQNPFLSNGSIKDNIVGYSPFNQARYEEIIEACMLQTDLLLLPYGDDTKIGSNGIMLSGGQKQRVSLARALYLNSNLLIFDDILSGLDNDTAAEVFRRVFGIDGIIRRRKATAVLCTHAIKYLPLADHIIALGSDGTLVEEGNFADLMRDKKYVASLGVTALDSGSDSDSEVGAELEDKTAQPPKPKRAPAIAADLLEKSRQTGDIKVYVHYFRSLGLTSVILFFVGCILHSVWYNFPTIWMKYWTEDTLNKSSTYYVGIYALFRVLQLLSLLVAGVASIIYMTTSSGTTLHHQALRTVINAPLTFFTTTDSGVVTNLFSQDMTLIDNELPMALFNAVFDFFDAIGMAAVIAVASPYMAISYPLLIGACWIIQKFYLRTSRQLRLLDLESKSPLYTHFLDTIKGVATIRAFGWVGKDIAHNQHLLDTSQRPAYLLAMIQQWLVVTMQLLVACMAVILVALATQLRANSGFTGASLVTLMSWGETIAMVIRFYTQLETSIGAVSRIKTFSEKVKPEHLEGEDIVPPEQWPEKGSIEIKGVSASYRNEQQASEDGESTPPSLALKDVTFSIQPGQKVALCGRTGSGKSSLILLLLRLLDPVSSSSRNMEMDGIPFHRIDRAALRRRIIAVPQDAVFLPDGTSIKLNLDPFNAASDAECLSVLRTVQLAGFVEERGGLDEGLSADSLSAGQKQLFSLGRAILRRRIKDAKFKRRGGGILLLDEVSSSVDHATDRLMQEIIKEEFGTYTIVMVSHRLDMVMDFFDAVIVMDKGRVVETGSPRDLVGTAGSRFGELWAIENQGRSREA